MSLLHTEQLKLIRLEKPVGNNDETEKITSTTKSKWRLLFHEHFDVDNICGVDYTSKVKLPSFQCFQCKKTIFDRIVTFQICFFK